MRTLAKTFFGTMLLQAVSTHCFGETMISDVTRERAKAMGVTMLSWKNGDAGIKVTLKFQTRGVMKDFAGAELRITADRKHLVSAPLKVSRLDSESVSVSFSVAPSSMANSAFWIYVDDSPRGGSAYRFKVKDFIQLPIR